MRSPTPQHEPIRSSEPSAASPAAQIRVGQILILAMIMGVIMFAGVALYLRSTATVSKAIDPNNQGVMLLTLAAIFVATLAASLAARTLYVAQIRRRAEREGANESLVWVAGSRFSQMAILRGALHEGPSLFGVVIVLLGGDLVALAAPAIGILLMLTLALPTRAKYESFILDATGKYPT